MTDNRNAGESTDPTLIRVLSIGRSLVINVLLFTATCAFAILLVRAVRSNAITIRPIPVPEALSKRGFTPEVAATRVVAAMRQVERDVTTRMALRRFLGTDDRPDFQLPGQPLSFRVLTAYLQELFGVTRPSISADITDQSGAYVAVIRVNGGEYDGSAVTVAALPDESTDAFLGNVARAAVGVAEPYLMAVYESGIAERRCRETGVCDYSKALELHDRMLVPPRRSDAKWALLGRSYIYSNMSRFSDAARDAADAVGLDPAFASAYVNWGAALSGQGDHRAALAKFTQAIAVDSHDAVAYRDSGDELRQLGDSAKAIEMYRRSLQIDPTGAAAHVGWGLALQDLGDNGHGIDHYKMAIAADASNALAYYNWGRALALDGDFAGAWEKLSKAVALNARVPGFHDSLGFDLFMLGSVAEAIGEYKKALELDRRFVTAYANWALALWAQGNKKQAVETFAAAVALSPDVAESYKRRAAHLDSHGRGDTALQVRALVAAAQHLPPAPQRPAPARAPRDP